MISLYENIKCSRAIDSQNIPRPKFGYQAFELWRSSNHNKFVIEVGCGVGLHPILWAKLNPSSKILAIERTTEKFNKFHRRLSRHNLSNIFPAHAEAGTLLPHLNIKKSVDEIYVLYPNPYPKAKHKNLRFAHSAITGLFYELLKPDGMIVFATNIKSYAIELAHQLPKNFPFELSNSSIIPLDQRPRSHFEAKYLKRDEECYELVFKNV